MTATFISIYDPIAESLPCNNQGASGQAPNRFPEAETSPFFRYFFAI